jgi:two-component system sensor histidine kinase HydH
MLNKTKTKRFLTGVPPWLLIGAFVVLVPIVTFMTVTNIHRQQEKSIQLLLEKGAALIRSFEAGTRTGMMGMHWGSSQLQLLLSETAKQPDIVYLFVADTQGKILAHNNLRKVGFSVTEKDLNLAEISQDNKLHWHQKLLPDGKRVFEVFRRFTPLRRPMGIMHGPMMMGRGYSSRPNETSDLAESPQVIFIGLDMTPIEEAYRADIRHAVIMGAILLLVGFAGITLLFLAQSYRTTRASLNRIKAFSDNVVENIPVGLLALDDHKRIAAFNQVAESVLQLSSGEVIGREAGRVLPPELWSQIEGPDIQRGIIEKEIECKTADGKLVPLEIGASVLKDENGVFLGFVLLFKDLTEVRTLRKEIARSQHLASVGRLAAGVAHEIRNPLSSIKGFATYFKERYQNAPEDQQTANIMIQEVDRLNRVVGQLLEFSRPVTVSPKPTSIKTLVEDSVKLVEGQAHEKQITIKIINSSMVEELNLDPDRISQVLLNLYLNAIESMPAGGLLRVTLSSRTENKALEIEVSDTGCGISREDLSRIFDPYFTTKSSGTGLGLAIAHNIIEALGGQINVQSRMGQGTTFRITLPISKNP